MVLIMIQYRQSALPLKGKNYYDTPSNPKGYSSSSFFFNWLVENQLDLYYNYQ